MSPSTPGEPNPYEAPEFEPIPPTGGGPSYEELPWYRKSPNLSAFVLLGLCCSPAILFVCIVVLTGEVYFNKRDKRGNLAKWSYANKVAAFIIMFFQVSVTVYQIYAFVHNPNR